MHASIIFTTVALVATAFAGPLLETRTCPTGPYKEGSSCGENCLGALKCSDNLYDVVRTTSPYPPPQTCPALFLFFSFLSFSFLFFSFLFSSPSFTAIYILSSLPDCYQHSFPASPLHISSPQEKCIENHHVRYLLPRFAEAPQIQCSDYQWVAFEHCEAPICSYGTC